MRALLWKQWHEQWWKLACCTLTLTALTLIGLRARIVPDTEVGSVLCFVSAMMLPLLACTGLVPAERASESFEMLIALPIAAGEVFLANVFSGMTMCALPYFCGYLAAILTAGGREFDASRWLLLYGGACMASVFQFLCMFALTIRIPTVPRAGLTCLGVLFMWAMIGIAVGTRQLTPHAIVLTPFVFIIDEFRTTSHLWAAVLVQSILCAAGLAVAQRHFASLEEKP